ncbi:MFS transporter [Lewinellaceae bacterium SD302]|nr:MFS transporter [Lewinellaceae bacterium SD302]
MKSLLLILGNRRYFAPVWLFASLNIVVSTWVLYVPTVKARLELSDGELGLALFAFSMGLLSIIPASSFLLRKLGLGRLSFISVVTFASLMLLPVQATSYTFLVVSLYCSGIFVSLTDIGMNSLVSEIELEDDVHFMSAAHGFFSLGGVIGAGIGSLLLAKFTAPVYHSLAVAVFVLVTNGLLLSSYYRNQSRKADRGEGGKFKFSLIKPLLGLTLLAVIIMGSEGAIEHWSKLYLLEVVGSVTDQVAGFGYVVFSATMTTGRFLGDGISERFGSLKIVIGGSLLAAAGFALVLVATFWLAMIGFGLVGIGFSVIIPELFRLAGRAKGVSSAEGISVVAGLGYVGFLASPALLGFLSDWGTLRLSFTFLLGAAVVAAVIGVILKLRRVGE